MTGEWDAEGFFRALRTGAVRLHKVTGHQVDNAVFRVEHHIDDKVEPHAARDLLKPVAALVFHLAERKITHQRRGNMRGRDRLLAAAAGIKDLGAAGVPGVGMRDDVAKADKKISLHRSPVHADRDLDTTDGDALERDEGGSIAIVVLTDF